MTEERASPQRLETVQAVQKVQTVQKVEGHGPNATKSGILEGWNDAFDTQYSNIPTPHFFMRSCARALRSPQCIVPFLGL